MQLRGGSRPRDICNYLSFGWFTCGKIDNNQTGKYNTEVGREGGTGALGTGGGSGGILLLGGSSVLLFVAVTHSSLLFCCDVFYFITVATVRCSLMVLLNPGLLHEGLIESSGCGMPLSCVG